MASIVGARVGLLRHGQNIGPQLTQGISREKKRAKKQGNAKRSCTRVRGPPVALHMSQQISSESLGFSGVAAVSRYTPLKGPVAPVALELPGVSHVKLPLKRCRATGGVAATLAGVALCN